MSSRIEQLIDEIEEYIDSCKYQTFSNSKILVNKDEIEELIRELRVKTPDEIKRYQRIIQNKEEILNDAKAKAEQLIKDTTLQRTELISEHQIMQQAYAQADEVVTAASRQAQEILDRAVMEANEMRISAMQYTDDLLSHVENIVAGSIQTASADYENLIGHMKQYQEIIAANRRELVPIPDDLDEEDSGGTAAAEPKENLELM
ncbi:vacuolar family H+-ATPase subunit H [bacterium 1XD8-76]|nr:vacuolar family H+-ATPase subunit H [bacterium 1XD8-76]